MFSTIYNQSFKFLTSAVAGLEQFLEILFMPFSELLTDSLAGLNIFAIFPDWLIGDWLNNLLSHSVITFTLGSGVLIYVGITLVKYIIGIVT